MRENRTRELTGEVLSQVREASGQRGSATRVAADQEETAEFRWRTTGDDKSLQTIECAEKATPELQK